MGILLIKVKVSRFRSPVAPVSIGFLERDISGRAARLWELRRKTCKTTGNFRALTGCGLEGTWRAGSPRGAFYPTL
jgi:hypothetical protein